MCFQSSAVFLLSSGIQGSVAHSFPIAFASARVAAAFFSKASMGRCDDGDVKPFCCSNWRI